MEGRDSSASFWHSDSRDGTEDGRVSVNRRAVWAGLALGLPLIDVALLPTWPWLTALAVLAVTLALGRSQSRVLKLIILLPLAFDLTARVHFAVVSHSSPYDALTMSPTQFAAQLQERLDRLTADLTAAAQQAAALPQVRTLRGRASRRNLFLALEREQAALASSLGQDLTLAVYAASGEPVAWTSRAVDVPSEAAVPQRVFVVSGDTSASLVVRVGLDGGESLTAALPLLAPGIGSAPTDFLLSGWEGAFSSQDREGGRSPPSPFNAHPARPRRLFGATIARGASTSRSCLRPCYSSCCSLPGERRGWCLVPPGRDSSCGSCAYRSPPGVDGGRLPGWTWAT
jgi:hypothetical protein